MYLPVAYKFEIELKYIRMFEIIVYEYTNKVNLRIFQTSTFLEAGERQIEKTMASGWRQDNVIWEMEPGSL